MHGAAIPPAGFAEATEDLIAFAEPFVAAQLGAGGRKLGIELALQELINDLYDGFLSEEDRTKLIKEKGGPLPLLRKPLKAPRVEIGSVEMLFPSFDARNRSIQFPIWLAQPNGILAWVSLAHETCGHAIFDAYGLERSLRRDVSRRLSEVKAGQKWLEWFDEAASDCLAVLNLGPTMALGSIASWRALPKLVAPESNPRLPCAALEPGGVHPPPVLRAYLMAHLIGRLRFHGAKKASAALKQQIQSELKACRCGREQLQGAEVFADTLIAQPQEALNGFCFDDLQNWSDQDEAIVGKLRLILRKDEFPRRVGARHYAAHAVAAAILELVDRRGPRAHGHRVLPNLIRLLRLMHDSDRGKRARRELKRYGSARITV